MTDSVYTVTPPDLRMSSNAPTIMLLGIKYKDATPYIDLFDSVYSNLDLTIYTSEDGLTTENIAWYRAALGTASVVIADIDQMTTEEFFMAAQCCHDSQFLVFWVGDEKSSMTPVLNSYQYSVFSGVKEIQEHFEAEIQPQS